MSGHSGEGCPWGVEVNGTSHEEVRSGENERSRCTGTLRLTRVLGTPWLCPVFPLSQVSG